MYADQKSKKKKKVIETIWSGGVLFNTVNGQERILEYGCQI